MTAITFKQGDEKWAKQRKQAEENFYWFNAMVLGFINFKFFQEDTHKLVHRFMQRNTGVSYIDEAPFQMLQMPRETGKSTCGTVGYAIWMACKHPNIAILIANEKEETAKDFIKSIKWHFEANALLRALFPEVIPPDFNQTEWSSTRATLRRTTGRPEATFDCTGVGGTKVGKHYDIILCDDLISKEGRESAIRQSWIAVEETSRWVNQLPPLLSAGARQTIGPGFPFIRFIGTRWFQGDTYEHIEKVFSYKEDKRKFNLTIKLSNGSTVSHEIYRAGDLSVLRLSGIKDGKATFPEVWSLDRIEKWRYSDPELVACNILNDPVAEGLTSFREDWLTYWTWGSNESSISYTLADGKRRVVDVDSLLKRAVTDPAFTSNSNASRAAVIILGTDLETGKHLVLDCIAKHQDPKDNLEDFLNLCAQWNCRKAYVELAGQQLSYLQWLQSEARNRNLPLSIEDVRPGGRSKDVRIEGLIVPFKDSKIVVHASQHVFFEEYRHWRPGSRKADVLDALAYAIEQAPKPRTGNSNSPTNRSRMQLNSYYRRRGLLQPAKV